MQINAQKPQNPLRQSELLKGLLNNRVNYG